MSAKRKGGQRGEEFKQEDVLQAVVLADSFNVKFAPITHRKPRALLPLVNVPLLDYTLEWLSSSGIQEVIIFCCIHADQIKQHIEKSKWSCDSSSMEVTVTTSETCLSMGDAFRDIDAKSVVRSDFVLVTGDMIASVNLKPIIEEHKQRRQKEKTPIMTMVYKHASPGHQTRCQEEEVVMAINTSNNRVLHFQKVGHSKKFRIPVELFAENSSMQLRYDLQDCHICVCSPQVPLLFTENFDYLSRDDFVRGILVNEEILGNTIHIHTIEDEYAARVSNLHQYDAISKDVINRWSYPLVPDQNIFSNSTETYLYGRHNVYLAKDVTRARGCVLKENVVIGGGTCIGSDTQISHSVIGRNCTIGENVKIKNAYLWDGVRVDDDCTVQMALLAEGVHLKRDVCVQAGCVLAENVVIGANVTLPPGTMLMAEPHKDDEDDFDSDEEGQTMQSGIVLDPRLAGEDGIAYQYLAPADSDDETELLAQSAWGLSIESDDDEASSYGSDVDDEEIMMPVSPPPDDTNLFYDEVIGTLERALEENIGFDNMVLEVNSLKHAYNIQIKEVNVLVTKALMGMPLRKDTTPEPGQYLVQVKQVLTKLLSLLRNYIKSEESQVDCLSALEELSLTNSTAEAVLMKVIHFLYELDILSEEAILRWFNNPPDDDLANRQHVRQLVTPFIKWLQEAEEETDSGEDSD